MKLHQGKFRLDIRIRESFRLEKTIKFFTERVVSHWNRLSREVVMAPSLSFRKSCKERELDSMILMSPFHLEILYVLLSKFCPFC